MTVLVTIDITADEPLNECLEDLGLSTFDLGEREIASVIRAIALKLIIADNYRLEEVLNCLEKFPELDIPPIATIGLMNPELLDHAVAKGIRVHLLAESTAHLSKNYFAVCLQYLIQSVPLRSPKGEKNDSLVASELGSYLSHEINNPLGAASLRIAVVEEILKDLNDKNLRIEIENELNEVSHIHKRISKITAALRRLTLNGENEPKTFVTIEELFADLNVLCAFRMHGNGVNFKTSSDIPLEKVWCNPVEIVQTLVNLTVNAMHAVQESAGPWVIVEANLSNAGWVEFKVIDSGKGISEEIANKIFDPYVSSKRASGGTGLGLSFSKSVIEKHGGELKLEGEATNTTFVFSLPMQPLAKDIA